jgi:hypothetical protein
MMPVIYMCFTLALAYALALASIINYDDSDAPNCGVTYDCHYDDRNSFIIQATGFPTIYLLLEERIKLKC